MYRDVWTHVFGTAFRVKVTHQARVSSASSDILSAKRVVFGGGGLLYNSLGRDHGMAELKLLREWHRLLRQTRTPYGFASIGFQPKDPPTEGMNASTMDGGIFCLVREFVRDAAFITARSAADRRLFEQWNANVHEFSDLAFALRKVGLASAKPETNRTSLVTVGLPQDYSQELIASVRDAASRHTHYHVTVSEHDYDAADFSRWHLQPILVNEPALYDEAPYFARAQHVFTTRFHGMVMAKLYAVPHVTPVLRQWKVVTFVDKADKEADALGHLWHVYSFLRST